MYIRDLISWFLLHVGFLLFKMMMWAEKNIVLKLGALGPIKKEA